MKRPLRLRLKSVNHHWELRRWLWGRPLLREVSKDRALSEAANAVAVTGGILTVLHQDGSSERLEFPCPPDALEMEISGLESCPLEGPVPMEVAGSSWIAHPLASASAGLAEIDEA